MPNRPILDHFFSSQRPLFAMSPRVWNPPTDIYETADTTFIKIEVAGLDEEHLQILHEGSTLIVRGQRTKQVQPEGVHYQLMEVPYGHFERRFRFHSPLERAQIEFQYEQGFLIIQLPRQEHAPTKIEIPDASKPSTTKR